MDAPKRYHSVQLDKSRCKGCTNCLMHCPTEAIRVRDGRAHIIAERCIDCGECIRICDYHAKVAVTDKFDTIKAFRYAIALPAPSLYGQFRNLQSVQPVLSALKKIGFDDVFEVARGADIVALTAGSKAADMRKTAENVLSVPDTHVILQPSLGVIPLQLFAYYVALHKGCDIDKPRNLAKSVSVE